jgi:hypothetical protein
VLWRRAGLRMPVLVGWTLTMLFVILTWVLFRAPDFGAAMQVFEGLVGLAPLGADFKWRAIVLAAAFAMIGPTAWTLVHAVPPRRSIAVVFGIVLVAVLLKIGDDVNYEFIYFQF